MFELYVADIVAAGNKLKLEYGNSVEIVEKINTRVDAFLADQVQVQDSGLKLTGTETSTPPPKAVVVKTEPQSRRVSDRSTKGERLSTRLEDEKSPVRIIVKKEPNLAQKVTQLHIKIARLEGKAESHQDAVRKLKRQRGNNASNASEWKAKCITCRADIKQLKAELAETKMQLVVANTAPKTTEQTVELNTPELEAKLMVRYKTTKRPKFYSPASQEPPKRPKIEDGARPYRPEVTHVWESRPQPRRAPRSPERHYDRDHGHPHHRARRPSPYDYKNHRYQSSEYYEHQRRRYY